MCKLVVHTTHCCICIHSTVMHSIVRLTSLQCFASLAPHRQVNAWAWNHGYTLDSVGSADAVNGVFAPGALALAPVANLNASAKLPLSGLWRWV